MMSNGTTVNTTSTSRRMMNWRSWLIPKPFDWVSTFLYVCTFGLFLYFHLPPYCPCPFQPAQALALAGALVLLLLIDRFEYARYGETPPTRVAALLLIARILLIRAASILDDNNFSAFMYLLIPFIAMQSFKAWVGFVLADVFWFIYLLDVWQKHPLWYLDVHQMSILILMGMGLIFMVIMAKTVLNEKESRKQAEKLLYELEISHRQLRAYAEQVDELATTRERNRLARDIHDSLGHYLTVINVQLEKAQVLRDKKPNEAEQSVRDAKRLASEALQDIRRSVSALRTSTERLSLRRVLSTLVENTQTERLKVLLTIDGSESEFSQQTLMVLYRAAQEGLTNVQKHANANRVEIKLRFGADSAELIIQDNGQGFDILPAGQDDKHENGHYGLQGLQERLELVDGTLKLESCPGTGTRLLIKVPKHSPVHHALPGMEELPLR